jgi:hypothetical protein
VTRTPECAAHGARTSAGCDLFAEAVRRFGSHQVRVGGRSMLPAIWPGDRITIHAVPHDAIGAGDVVGIRRGATLVVHRVVGWVTLPAGLHIVTRGDALRQADAPMPAACVVGRVSDVRRGPFHVVPSGSAGRAWRVLAFLVEGLRLRLAAGAVWRLLIPRHVGGRPALGKVWRGTA